MKDRITRALPLLALSACLAACGGATAPASSGPAAPGAVASTLASKPAALASTAPASRQLTIVQGAYPQVSAVHTPMYVAKEEGFFAQNGLDVQLKIVQGP